MCACGRRRRRGAGAQKVPSNHVISTQGMFEPYMKSFYVRSTDATHIKTLKVET